MKTAGLGDNFYVSGYDLSGDTGAVSQLATPRGTTTITGINKSAMERAHTHKGGGVQWQAWFNPSAGQAHEALSSLPTADRIVTYLNGASAVGDSAMSMIGKQINYNPSRGEDGALTIAVNAVSNGYGAEWGQALTAGIRTDSGATAGASHDYGVTIGQTLFGAQAYLHVVSFTGTDATITVEDSTNDSTWASLVAFTEVSSLLGANSQASERVQTGRAETVDRYLRVTTTTSAGFTDLQFFVMVVKNEQEELF